jgi:hypothetical protein
MWKTWGESLRRFSEFQEHLSKLASDSEISDALRKFFFEFGVVSDVGRFRGNSISDKRCFLIRFKNFSDASKASNFCKLRSFAFDGVLVEVDFPMGDASWRSENIAATK